jgi:YVTN family beta-propeller protein
MKNKIIGYLGLFVFAAMSLRAEYKVLAHYPVGGGTAFDYVRIDSSMRRLYIAHGVQVDVLNADTGDKLGVIAPTKGVHGVAIVNKLNRGFITCGGDRSVAVFDLVTLKIEKVITGLGVKPDAIEYDEATNRVYVANGTSGGITVIDPSTLTIAAVVPLIGKLEGMAFDGRGHLFVNTEDKSAIQVVDLKTLKPLASWSIDPVEGGTGLAIDPITHRLFASGGNNLLAVVDSDSGRLVATPAIGEDPDGDCFDSTKKLIFTSNVEGTISILHEDSADKYTLVQTLPTAYGARTITAVDSKTGHVYLVTGKFADPQKAADGQKPGRRKMIPNSFEVLVVGE